MKIFREIFGRIWAVWGLLAFFVTMLLFMIPFFIFVYPTPDPLKTRRFIRYSKTWMDIYLFLIGCPLTVLGRGNFRPGENYIVLCNHNALMDVPVSSPAIPGGNKTIAKIEINKVPIFNMLYRTGSVLVDRKSDRSRKESYAKMLAVLEMGLHMCIYPEGTRNKTNQPLKSFHDGAFRLAMESRKAIIPGVIFHTRTVMPHDKIFYLWPHRLEIHFLPEIKPVAGQSPESLKQETYRVMQAEYLRGTKSA